MLAQGQPRQPGLIASSGLETARFHSPGDTKKFSRMDPVSARLNYDIRRQVCYERARGPDYVDAPLSEPSDDGEDNPAPFTDEEVQEAINMPDAPPVVANVEPQLAEAVLHQRYTVTEALKLQDVELHRHNEDKRLAVDAVREKVSKVHRARRLLDTYREREAKRKAEKRRKMIYKYLEEHLKSSERILENAFHMHEDSARKQRYYDGELKRLTAKLQEECEKLGYSDFDTLWEDCLKKEQVLIAEDNKRQEKLGQTESQDLLRSLGSSDEDSNLDY